MKTVLKHITSLGLILLLLVSTLQLSIYRMDCLMSGKTKISLSEFDDCNKGKSAEDCSITQQCCCFHQMDLNFDFDTSLSDEAPAINLPVLNASINIQTLSNELPRILSFYHSDLPPPGGIEFLKEIQVYRL